MAKDFKSSPRLAAVSPDKFSAGDEIEFRAFQDNDVTTVIRIDSGVIIAVHMHSRSLSIAWDTPGGEPYVENTLMDTFLNIFWLGPMIAEEIE